MWQGSYRRDRVNVDCAGATWSYTDGNDSVVAEKRDKENNRSSDQRKN
jgi:hypothetical protein